MKDEDILSLWKEDETFKKSVEKDAKSDYVFFDGPPFANGLPHYGHLLTGFIKDAFARYHTMIGERVKRRFGWDCHGLPAEMEVEKELKIQGKKAIQEYGIENFNNACRSSVLKYTKEWRKYVERQGRWVDFQDEYKTMDKSYMESVMWAFKELYKKGLIKEEHRVMPYSWKTESLVSNFETKMDNCYREKVSKAVYLKFKLKEVPSFIKNKIQNKPCYLLVWTTTPWTLPANLALAVNKDIKYSVIEKNNEILIFAENLKDKISKILEKKTKINN